MEFEAILAKEIKKLRQDTGLTQAELGAKTGLDANYISKLERNEKTPRFTTMLKICHATNTTLSALVIRVEEQIKLT